ncbi:MAG: Methyl-accepting chemotaxis protein [Firmicutes bacterium]|nr:Methyl-accepting chemotaxis protein [Bacillota bacterium]
MALIEWNQNFSVSVAELDKEHKKLVDMINSLHESMKSGKGKEIIAKILDEITDYALKHFNHEEKLMVQYNYQTYEEHKAVHDNFVKKIAELRTLHDQKLLHAGQLLNTLQDWLINHICDVDKNYSSILSEAMKK